MTIELMPELGVEITPDISYIDLRERAEAACRSALLLEKHGLDIDGTPADKEAAAALTAAYAEDPERASKLTNHVRASTMTPASLINIRDYLDEYGKQVVTHAVEMRHLVTNRLLEESRHPDARIRVRALELLGKHSDIGLFTERSEININYNSPESLESAIKERVKRLLNAEVIDMKPLGMDLDEELGITDADFSEVLSEADAAAEGRDPEEEDE